MKLSSVVSLKSARARKARADLRLHLGDCCKHCGFRGPLEFDCIQPTGPAHHLMAWPERIRFYWQQALQNNLQLLCRPCHLAKTQRDNCKARGFPVF